MSNPFDGLLALLELDDKKIKKSLKKKIKERNEETRKNCDHEWETVKDYEGLGRHEYKKIGIVFEDTLWRCKKCGEEM